MKLIDQTTLAVIQLPDTLIWQDEFNWSRMVSSHSYSLAGALIVEQGERLDGRPITLGADGDMDWVTRATVVALVEASALTGRLFTLKMEYPLDTREFTVVFAAEDPPIEASPVLNLPSDKAGDWFHLTLKLVEVTAP